MNEAVKDRLGQLSQFARDKRGEDLCKGRGGDREERSLDTTIVWACSPGGKSVEKRSEIGRASCRERV